MELTDAVKADLKKVVDHFDREDTATRERQIRVWRRLKFLWDNLQHTYYSEVAHDWRVPETRDYTTDQDYYDKPINVFRAYLESIIAALSINIPAITCYPDDANNTLDILTARAGDNIAKLLYRHNDVPLLWLHALYLYCTEGMLACHVQPKSDKKFGMDEENKYEDVEVNHTEQSCPNCGAVMGNDTDGLLPEGQQDNCPACGQMVTPQTESTVTTEQHIIGVERNPKTRVLFEIYGGLYVKVPVWARKQEDCPYLILSYETHISNVLSIYKELRNTLKGIGTSSNDEYERWGRLSPQYRGEYPQDNVTVRNAWLRPSAFNVLDEDTAEKYQKDFPDGAKVVLVNDQVVDVIAEDLDTRWVLSYNPLADSLHFDPLGLLLESVQEITNDIISLTIQTMEHGIPQTFANPKFLDFEAYRQQEVIPGGVYPTIPGSRPVGEGFYEVKTATLSQEVMPFAVKIQEMGQLVSGALPSLFGGQATQGSGTAAEYSMSRSQALQRLQTTWKVLTLWWKNIMTAAIPMYINEMKNDENFVVKDTNGNFTNILIRKTEAEGGKLGEIELEGSDTLPVTWSQQKDAIMQLLQLNNEKVLETLGSPENLPLIRKALGLTDFTVPGENDRNKQYEEIDQLINSEPIEIPGMMDPLSGGMGQSQQLPSVDIDPDLDNHTIEYEVCRNWLVSDAGRLAKIDNPKGYLNVLLHMKAHKVAMMPMGGMAPMQPQSETPPNKGEPNGQA